MKIKCNHCKGDKIVLDMNGNPKKCNVCKGKGCTLIDLPKSKHNLGYVRKEVLDIIRLLGIHHKTFKKKFGVNTCAIHPDTGENLLYSCDVELAIRCCLEKRDKTIWEWD